MPVYAVIDIGTNSVKFHLAERTADGSWRTILDCATVTRLGEGLAESGVFAPAAMTRTIEAIGQMADQARRHQAAAVAAVGTMGLRTAGNRDLFIARVREDCGVDIEVLPSEEEGRLAYLGATSGLAFGAGRLVVFDSGGGSTQFTIGRDTVVDERFSFDVGSVRLTEQFGLGECVTLRQLETALMAVAAELARLDDVPSPDALVGMGGAVTTMTAVMLRLRAYDPELVQGSLLGRAEVERQITLYRTRREDERRRIVGLQPGRARVILAGACVVRTVMDKLGRDALTVSDRGLRHGLLLDRFG